jgi:hypothetical protein
VTPKTDRSEKVVIFSSFVLTCSSLQTDDTNHRPTLDDLPNSVVSVEEWLSALSLSNYSDKFTSRGYGNIQLVTTALPCLPLKSLRSMNSGLPMTILITWESPTRSIGNTHPHSPPHSFGIFVLSSAVF